MDGPTRQLFEAALAAQSRAHCPYSGYPVGAAVRTASGRIYTGCNVENASYPEGTCAESGAIAAMVLDGERTIETMLTVTDGATPGTPCGGCRQRIREFADETTTVVATTTAGAVLRMSIDELLPHSFGPERLAHRGASRT